MNFDEIDLGGAYIKSTNSNVIKIKINNFKGQVYVHIREFTMDGDTGKFFPTKSGYAIIGEELDSVIEKLQEASSILTEIYRKDPRQYKLL